jgi:hypothetical protein
MADVGQEQQVEKPPEKWFPLFGLVVVRKTDLLAATAFLLSVVAIIYQFYEFVRGANPQIFHPDTMYIYFDRYANGTTNTRFAGQISVTNTGGPGRSAVVRELAVKVAVGSRNFEQRWLSFGLVTRNDTRLAITPKEAAHALVVDGGSAASQLVTFAPHVRECATKSNLCSATENYVSDIGFLQELRQGAKVSFKFLATVFGSKRTLESECSVLITEDFMETLAENDWYAASCASPGIASDAKLNERTRLTKFANDRRPSRM